MIDENISRLVNYYLQEGYIEKEDGLYTYNKILHTLKRESGEYKKDEKGELYGALESILAYGVENNIIEDYQYERSNLEGRITDIFMEKPSYYNKRAKEVGFKEYLEEFLKMCTDVNYVKLKDNKRNKNFHYTGKKGKIKVSINLAKPEKDPKEIAKAKEAKGITYPKCPLCLENVGFYGNLNKASRSNLRTLEIDLNGDSWRFQFSPYMYYNEHCILLSKDHIPMKTTRETIEKQIAFVDKVPTYFVGNNGDIPIVGGSILGHNHFQGGRANFPMEESKIIDRFNRNNVVVEYLDWYLQTIRIVGSKVDVVAEVDRINNKFKNYENKEIKIYNNGENNGINIISRKVEDGLYSVYIIFRNNKTIDEFPFGIYHPDTPLHHIKKENIGLIEAMGLGILPGRLLKEMEEVKKYILGEGDSVDEKHMEFAKSLKKRYNGEEIDRYIQDGIGEKFEKVLSSCDIFRYVDEDKKISTIKEILYG